MYTCADVTKLRIILVAAGLLNITLILAWLYSRGVIDRLRSELVITKAAIASVTRKKI